MAGEADQFTADDGGSNGTTSPWLSEQEIRALALDAACRCYQGLTVIRGKREDAILDAAQRFTKYIDSGETS